MYTTCPKCRYVRQTSDRGTTDVCPRCGLVFAKWMKHRFHVGPPPADGDAEPTVPFVARLRATLLHAPAKIDPLIFYGRVFLYLAFLIWGWTFILMTVQSNEIGQSFMHNVNLVFHEAGHVLFRPFGRFMTILGGTLGQLLMPLTVMVALIWKNQDNFGASIGLWWLAQSMMDVAPYVNDARTGKLMLLGGVTGQDMPGVHDWRNILSDLGLLQYDHQIAAGVDAVGQLLMLLAFVWGGYILRLSYRRIQ